MTEQASTELALPTVTPDQYPSLYVSGGLDPYYQQIRQQVLSEVPDLTTKKGIARIKSLAAMVSSSKVAIEKPGREYLKQLKEMPKVIEAELRDWNQKMDALRDEVRQPVTDLEAKEKARISGLDQRLAVIQGMGAKATTESPSTEIQLWLDELEAISIDDSWQDYQGRAQVAKDAAKVKLEAFLQPRLMWEAQQAEIARLKAEQQEKDRVQREERIKEEARLEAERDLMRKQFESEQREKAAKEAQLKAEQDAEDAQRRLEQERLNAEERERLAAELAAEQERQRMAQEEADRKAEDERRFADVEHRRTYNNQIINDLMLALPSLTKDDAITLLTAMVQHKIRHTSVQY